MKLNTLRIGVAAGNITPPVGPILQGHWNHNSSHAVLRPLEMRTVVARNNEMTVCIVTLDAIGVSALLTARIRTLIADATDIPKDNILITASHTHCAPAVLPALGLTPDPIFTRLIEQQAVVTARLANNSLQPVTLGLGCGSAFFNVSRRPLPGTQTVMPNYGGVVDRRVRLLRLDAINGEPMAILFHYTCHPTSKSGSEGIISPDYPGFARTEIEETLGCPALFLPGCFGNIRPNVTDEDGTFSFATETQLQELGHELAQSVCHTALSTRTVTDEHLSARQTTLILPYTAIAPPSELKAIIDDPKAHELHRMWAKKLLEQQRTSQIPNDCYTEMMGIRVGPLQLVAIPGEPVLEIGQAIERRYRPKTGAREIWPVGYANDMIGYLCTKRHYLEGGYEPNAYPYCNQPASFDDEERRIVDAADSLIY